MPPHVVNVEDEDHTVTIQLDGTTATISVGGGGRFRIILDGTDASARLGGAGEPGSLRIDNADGRRSVTLDGADATVRLRPPPEPGGLAGQDPQGPTTVELDGKQGHAVLGGIGRSGRLVVNTEDGAPSIELVGQTGALRVGTADGQFGTVVLENRAGVAKIALNGESGQLIGDQVRARGVALIDDGGKPRVALDGPGSSVVVGFKGEAGTILVRDAEQEAVIRLSGTGRVTVGGSGQHGEVSLFDATGTRTIRALGSSGEMSVDELNARTVTAKELVVQEDLHTRGDISVISSGGSRTIWLAPDRGTALLGGNGKDGDVAVFRASTANPNDLDDATIHLNGRTGDIILQNADCAEEFDVAADDSVDAGALLVIGAGGALELSRTAYDTRVAGIAAGAADRRPGIVLGRRRSEASRTAVALAGTVYCKVDAGYAPIGVGDLLSSSATPGHAMKATDRSRAVGAIVGKSLGHLSTGTGLLPVLVTLA